MRAAMTLGALVALAACGVPEAEDVQASRGAIQGLYFVPFDPEAVEKSDSWNEMLEEYAKN